jgi:hypothetical protein
VTDQRLDQCRPSAHRSTEDDNRTPLPRDNTGAYDDVSSRANGQEQFKVGLETLAKVAQIGVLADECSIGEQVPVAGIGPGRPSSRTIRVHF